MTTTRSQILAEMAAAERDAGWLAACEEAGCHLRVTQELAEAVARLVRALGPGPVLEVCAGRGELAAAVRRHGIDLVATDADPPPSESMVCHCLPAAVEVPFLEAKPLQAAGKQCHTGEVLRLDAAAALARFQPRTVIGCFVPVDSHVDQAVLAARCVQSYLVIAARINGQLGSRQLWSAAAWEARPLPHLTRYVVTRHDTWLGQRRGILRHGEAWLFERKRLSE